MLHLETVDPLDASPETYIDYSVMNSLMSGLLLALAACWAMVVFNRLWQGSLRRDAHEAIQAAERRGWTIHPAGLRARVVADGSVGSERIRVEWRGGWRGPHTVVMQGDRFQRTQLVTNADELDSLIVKAG